MACERRRAADVVWAVCSSGCRVCQGKGEWIVRVLLLVVVDLDGQVGRRRAQDLAARDPRIVGWSPSGEGKGWGRGGGHLYVTGDPSSDGADGPIAAARLYGGDPVYAQISRRRGWCGERPASTVHPALGTPGALRLINGVADAHALARFTMRVNPASAMVV